jgi:SAM-dependent methyltransferase
VENNYLNVVYNEKDRPLTKYPEKLVKYLIDRFQINKGSLILDTGCGRKEYINIFENNGMNMWGVDLENYDGKKVYKVNLETGKLPFPDNYFDCVYGKSILEHIHNPQSYVKETYRVLKPGGKFIVLVPDGITCLYTYMMDHTHQKYYVKESVVDLLKIHGYKDVMAQEFFQLPIVWKYPALKIVCKFLQFVFGAPKRIIKTKFIRWSVETMVLCVGTKN